MLIINTQTMLCSEPTAIFAGRKFFIFLDGRNLQAKKILELFFIDTFIVLFNWIDLWLSRNMREFTYSGGCLHK
jgi:hypothetical protein